MKLAKRDRNALLIAAVAAALFLLAQFVLLPVMGSAPGGASGVDTRELTLRRYQRLVRNSAVEQARVASGEERLKSLEGGLLDSPSPSLANAEWQRLIRDLAESKGIELGSSEFLKTQGLSPEYALVSGRVQLRCRLEQWVDFLVSLANSPKILSVTRMRVTTLQGDPQKRLNLDLTIGAVMRAPQSGAAEPPGKAPR